jgi:hypothetical protein
LSGSARQPVLNLRPETENIPAKSAADGYGAVGETVKLFELQAFAVPHTNHHPAAFCSQINAEIALSLHLISLELQPGTLMKNPL